MEIELEVVTKRFGQVVALRNVSLRIGHGDLMVLLGPSGCGKTTMLNLIAGLVQPTEGRVFIDGEDVTEIPPHRRGAGMVFQTGGLFPHLTVKENVCYGLEARGWQREAINKRFADVMKLTRLESVSRRYPNEVSGGQRQRAALARALAPNPRILLLDEPLSSIDARLRDELRWEIMDIQRRLGITTVYVTHDHDEAFYLSTKIAVMREGMILQTGEPRDIYDNPLNTFVAWFVGHNVLGPVEPVSGSQARLYMVVKPEDVRIESEKSSGRLEGRLAAINQRRGSYRALVETRYGNLEAALREEESDELRRYIGREVWLKFQHVRELVE